MSGVLTTEKRKRDRVGTGYIIACVSFFLRAARRKCTLSTLSHFFLLFSSELNLQSNCDAALYRTNHRGQTYGVRRRGAAPPNQPLHLTAAALRFFKVQRLTPPVFERRLTHLGAAQGGSHGVWSQGRAVATYPDTMFSDAGLRFPAGLPHGRDRTRFHGAWP